MERAPRVISTRPTSPPLQYSICDTATLNSKHPLRSIFIYDLHLRMHSLLTVHEYSTDSTAKCLRPTPRPLLTVMTSRTLSNRPTRQKINTRNKLRRRFRYFCPLLWYRVYQTDLSNCRGIIAAIERAENSKAGLYRLQLAGLKLSRKRNGTRR